MSTSNFAFEELVLGSLRASPLMKPFLMPGGWQELKCVYWKVSVGLKSVRISRIECFRPCIQVYPRMLFLKHYLKSPEAVNFIVGWKLFASSMKLFIAFCLCSPHREKIQ